ncbi:HAD hydrolase-like protein [Methylobacterium sp. Leaf399]|uniref:HAD hydrolase-like protein n=1 Tax=Methylobacterium sp. Leaf399 TaxID=1736364 RepID=UPI000B157FD7
MSPMARCGDDNLAHGSRPASARPYGLVAFDFDGTLADSFPWFCGVLNDVAARYRFRGVAEADLHTMRGMDARAIVRHLGIPAWKLPFVSRHMKALAVRDRADIGLFPGIAPMLRTLAGAGIPLAVVSSNGEGTIRTVLGPELAETIRYFACGASLFGKARRLAETVRRAGEPGTATLYVGDEIRDHEAATAAGCDFAAVSWGYTRADTLEARHPAFVFTKPTDIPAAVIPQ